MKKKILLVLGLALVLTLCASVALAENQAKIGETEYATFDEAVAAAADGDIIELLADGWTNGLNLSKNLTVDGNGNSLNFLKYGIALWGKSLTFKDMRVTMNNIGSTPYTAEWNWMTICASKDASLTLDNTKMSMNGADPNNPDSRLDKHAIYFCSNNKLNLINGSMLIISNYVQDALEWNGGDGGYNVNIIDSHFASVNNRSGFTGTFYATITNSEVNVVNSTGNGSNGTYYTIKDYSKVRFDNNVNWGISAWRIDMSNGSTLTATNNGYSGIWTRVLNVDGTCTVDVEGNGRAATGFTTNAGIFFQGNGTYKSVIEEGAKLTIKNNAGSGIYTKQSVCNMTIMSGTITNNGTGANNVNGQKGATYGGGIYNVGTMVLDDDVVLYNNHADTAGDDIYVDHGTITFGPTGEDWMLDGLPDCNGEIHAIDGWYEDGCWSAGVRWNADAEDENDRWISLVNPRKWEGTYAFKAAHDVIPVVTATPAPTNTPVPTNTPEPVAPPQTGDNSTPLAWLCALLACAACLTVLRFSRKRRA